MRRMRGVLFSTQEGSMNNSEIEYVVHQQGMVVEEINKQDDHLSNKQSQINDSGDRHTYGIDPSKN